MEVVTTVLAWAHHAELADGHLQHGLLVKPFMSVRCSHGFL